MTMPTHPSPDFLDLQTALAGEYSIQRELGRGGMGIVYLAREVQLDRDVAIKVLPAQLSVTPTARERFIREARLAASLSHPHIVLIHRVGEAGSFVFFVMSYVEGETLGERIRTRGPLPPAEASRVLREVAWALAYAHGRGIVHRDVKPDNILLETGTGRALVTDFGIAHGGKNSGLDTDPGKVMGTAHFMSPEQAAGLPIDGRSDIYALGVVGYLAVSGRLPFESANLPALMLRQASEPAPSVTRAAPGLPSAFSTAIDRCLARDPEGRFAKGEALAAALAPVPEVRPALPPSLRAWLGTQNPLLVPYLAWSGMFGTMAVANLVAFLSGNRLADPLLLAAISTAPLLPIVGFDLKQARRQFRAGYTLADLRTALDIARHERAEADASVREVEPRSHSSCGSRPPAPPAGSPWPSRPSRRATFTRAAPACSSIWRPSSAPSRWAPRAMPSTFSSSRGASACGGSKGSAPASGTAASVSGSPAGSARRSAPSSRGRPHSARPKRHSASPPRRSSRHCRRPPRSSAAACRCR
jgi:serine/threonine-protein kinase